MSIFDKPTPCALVTVDGHVLCEATSTEEPRGSPHGLVHRHWRFAGCAFRPDVGRYVRARLDRGFSVNVGIAFLDMDGRDWAAQANVERVHWSLEGRVEVHLAFQDGGSLLCVGKLKRAKTRSQWWRFRS
jgi:hypothetical protein